MNNIIFAAIISTVVAVPFVTNANETNKEVDVKASVPISGPMTTKADAIAKKLKNKGRLKITGYKAEIVYKDGKTSPAPDGQYTIKNGKRIVVKNGMLVRK